MERQLPPGHYWMKEYLGHFSLSLKRFPEQYLPLLFGGAPLNDEYHAYLCPICLSNYFIIDRIEYYSSTEFTEDHFPPESVGGTLSALVCKSCNNSAGGQFENSLVQKMEQVSFNKRVPNSVLKAKTVFDDVKGWRHTRLSVSDNKDVFFQLSITKNEKLPHISAEQLETNNYGKGWKGKVTPNQFSPEKVTKALLKTAYLYCFYNWGYDFAFSRSGELVRNAFLGKAVYPIEIGEWWLDFDTPVPAGHVIPEGLCFLSEPEALQIFTINIPMVLPASKYKSIVPVLIPSPELTAIEDLQRVQSVFKNNPNYNVILHPVNNALLHGLSDCYQRIWDDLLKERKNNNAN